jgi:hypothetical protein
MASHGRIIVNNELERLWKEVAGEVGPTGSVFARRN